MKKKKIGRPPIPKADRQLATVSFRMLKNERRMIGQAADACGVKLSEWIRTALLRVAEADIVEKRRVEESNPTAGEAAALEV